ncbi:MAG: alanine--tRNA ligase [Bacteroidota bacterium]
MNSNHIRHVFLDFFRQKQHQIVPSAPMVVKNDPTLMFTNAGMNQFKDIFLGNTPATYKRVADSQKCLRVSGKHNDLEEVGKDTYHHTMFEMLGNWSFGDYFKKEAIEWAWELLVDVYGIDKSRLYVTYFGGDASEGLNDDAEAHNLWKAILPESQILPGSKKDNFWEMGDSGPCGPCSEIHVDLRNEEDIAKLSGRELVNAGDPLVVEIWNLVFIEYNRMANGKLNPLPNKHVDTGMGFERLCMVLQKKQSNYDTDVFQPYIRFISESCKIPYGKDISTDIAMRVISDHIRTIAFAIADGQLPSNNKAGYVIRRILRRAVRYAYSFLDFKEPFLYKLMDVMVAQMGDIYPELKAQQDLITKVITEEESSFLRTLSNGIQRFEKYVANNKQTTIIDGAFAFELFDTFGFPIDLTQLMADELKLTVDVAGFEKKMLEQKERSRQAAVQETDDWVELQPISETVFVGYHQLDAEVEILKYRKITLKNKTLYQLVFNVTPFYAESGGQLGDKGIIFNDSCKIEIINTLKENNLTIHIVEKLPEDLKGTFTAQVDAVKRKQTEANHSATHLIHAALRKVLGTHVEQKGSMVDDERLRFDFSHFQAVTKEEIKAVERMVMEKVLENISSGIQQLSYDDAIATGAMALFGEKYGSEVRVVSFDKNYSVELCGGTHVNATGQIGLVVITSESAIAAGVRRIEAKTGLKAIEYIQSEYIHPIEVLKQTLKRNAGDIEAAVEQLIDKNNILQKTIDELNHEKVLSLAGEIMTSAENIKGVNYIARMVSLDAASIKDLTFHIKATHSNLILLLGAEAEGKAHLSLLITEDVVASLGLDATKLIREISSEIQGGGGGQAFYASAGGKNPAGLPKAFEKLRGLIASY